MSKKLLVIGASILQLPAIKRAKEKGFIVAVVDMNPKAIGIKYADKFYNISTLDKEKVYSAARDFSADGVMTLATDMPVRSVAYATNKLNLPGISFDTACKSTDKGEMIKTFKEQGVASPWFYIINDYNMLKKYIKEIRYPCIIKPVDNAGSRGVMLANDEHELLKAYPYSLQCSRNGKVIIEEFMQGPEVSVETMTIDGETTVLNITDKLTTGSPHFVEMGHSQPSILSEYDKIKITELAKQAVNAIGINIGPAHVEIILTAEGPKLVELGARMGGDCITTHLVPLSTGIDMVGLTIDLLTGQKVNLNSIINLGSAIRFISASSGIIEKIDGLEEVRKINGVKEVCLMKHVGEKVTDINSSLDRVGYVIAQGKTAIEAMDICEEALSKINILTKE
ncbi:ATP-grasp domain-containing protein [Niallia endozanthoxylica]|uniref:ATP-grasp domain-containing protein n=1 Tax=Niallia endozanthoxylica TaxID=2036016 RepID=A0A5J5GZN2_9BACI|nr:ATP-grasp domain-containing protein [Niallia endozanthoxylica]KAA9013826.1 ATP-grasp domain-containing protein [Niallia endozanthoxylica]